MKEAKQPLSKESISLGLSMKEHLKSLSMGRNIGLRDAYAYLFMKIRLEEESSLEKVLTEVAEAYLENLGDNPHVQHFIDKHKHDISKNHQKN